MWAFWPLDDAHLKAIAGGIGACNGGRGAAAVARVGVVSRVGGVDGRAGRGAIGAGIEEGVVANEDKVSMAGVFLRHEESKSHRGERTGSRRGSRPAHVKTYDDKCVWRQENRRDAEWIMSAPYACCTEKVGKQQRVSA